MKAIEKLESYRRHFSGENGHAYAMILRFQSPLIKLCLAADLFRYKLTDLLETFKAIEAKDVGI